ncbi:MAG TPA: F0F1 ATP synthase subunit delta [Candidatus Saccharimonadales bacterium]|nr:F0F1 ATP synthase subunit delta [Candidatus Saccharimonadales bacterium]
MARLARRRLAREVVRMLSAQPERRADVVKQLAAHLIANKQKGQLDLLMQDIADELYLQQKQLSVEVDYVFEPSQATKDAIVALLRDATGATTIDLSTQQNPDLLGGIVLRTPRQEIDASVRRKLNLIAGGIK